MEDATTIQAKDYVIATGEQYSLAILSLVSRRIRYAINSITLEEEYATVKSLKNSQKQDCPGDVVVRVDPSYYRPAEVETNGRS